MSVKASDPAKLPMTLNLLKSCSKALYVPRQPRNYQLKAVHRFALIRSV